jgi:hypothetical protein
LDFGNLIVEFAVEEFSLKVTGKCVIMIVLKTCVHGLESVKTEKVAELEFIVTVLFCCNSKVA